MGCLDHRKPNATNTTTRRVMSRVVAAWLTLTSGLTVVVLYYVHSSHLTTNTWHRGLESQMDFPGTMSRGYKTKEIHATNTTRTIESQASALAIEATTSFAFNEPTARTESLSSAMKKSFARTELSSLSVSSLLSSKLVSSPLPTTAPITALQNSAELNDNNHDFNKGQTTDGSVLLVDQKGNDFSIDLTQTNTSASTRGGTFALLFPAGLNGGFRNQVMRFIGFLRSADRDGLTRLLLPTVVWSARYKKLDENLGGINPSVYFWPVPFDELFDVDYWNSFHDPSHNSTKTPSLPKLVTSLENEEEVENDDDWCWKPSVDPNIVSVQALQNHPVYNQTFSKSFLPLLTYRMLFGYDDDNEYSPRNTNTKNRSNLGTFVISRLQDQVLDYLVGGKIARKRNRNKIDFRPIVRNCTRPYVYGGNSVVLWYEYLTMERRAPGVSPKRSHSDPHEEDSPPVPRDSGLLKAARRKSRKHYPRDDESARYETRFVNTVNDALVPAKPWRQLADQCVRHHLREQRGESGYVALHARIEPEMLSHTCGKDMERNLTTVLDRVEALAKDYNEAVTKVPTETRSNSDGPVSGENPISEELRERLPAEGRALGGIFVAVARGEMQEYKQWPKVAEITRYNWGVLNARSSSYDKEGNELFTSSLRESEGQYQERETNAALESSLPMFECGEGWVEHAFYLDEERQRKLFTPSNSDGDSEQRLDALYKKYGPSRNGSVLNPLLPLPNNYFGDILPSVLNFWLAVNADVFVGAMKSSYSNDVWTMRYYQGKGDQNFQYTADKGIVPIGNRGLPPPHDNCAKYKTG